MEPLQILLFSQYSFERFAPAVLTLVIFIYLVSRKKFDRAHRFLCYYFAAAFLYEAGHFITYSLYAPIGAYGWFLAALAPFGLVFLIQFAYSFSGNRCRREAQIVFAVTLLLSFSVYGEYIYSALHSGIKFSETGYAPDFSSKLIPLAVLLFYGWGIVVFIRNALFAEKGGENRSIIMRVLLPSTEGGQTARNFAFLVTLDLLKVVLISAYVFFRAIPYVTIISSVNALFLIIYALYAVVYVRCDLHHLSLRFKITGSIFILNIMIFSTMGYVALSQFESSYDESRVIELRYLTGTIRSGDFTNLPDDVDYIVQLTGPSYVWIYTRDPAFSNPQLMELNDFTPGRWRFTNTEQKIQPHYAYAMKRYFVQIQNINYNQFIVTVDGKRYGVGYNYYLYRKAANSPASILILIAILSSIGILFIIPFVLARVNPRSVDNAELSPAKRDEQMDVRVESADLLSAETVLSEEEDGKKDEDYIVTSDTQQKVQTSVAYINDNYMYDISREGAAAAVGMSPGRFGRAFLTCTGRKFNEYINDVRIEKAKVLLEGETSIIDIAYSVGFESLSTFSRAFNKNCGMTPSAYRDMLQKK